MGQFFERVLLQDKGMAGLMKTMSGIPKAMADIGYQPSEEGIGVSICFTQYDDSEWYDFESPLLEQAAETAEPLLKALAKECRLPVLKLSCIDSDFVVCRLLDATSETDTIACINEPYEDFGFGEPNYDAWAATCKKKWKCKPAQFQSVFEDKYTFAEDGLEQLSKLLHFMPASFSEEEPKPGQTFWFLPNEEVNEKSRLHTLAEKLADYMEREYAQKFEALGYCRYRNSPVRWHKIVGAPGKEVLLSMVFTTYHGFELAPFYGAQSLYCPLTLSDKYYPLHDDMEYWIEAKYEFYRKLGSTQMIELDETGRVTKESIFDVEKLPLFIDKLIVPELEKIHSLSDCRKAYSVSTNGEYGLWEGFAKVRRWIEAALDDDKEEVQCWYEKIKEHKAVFGTIRYDLEDVMVQAYENGGCEALIEYLRSTVYQDNIKKLKRAGIIQ